MAIKSLRSGGVAAEDAFFIKPLLIEQVLPLWTIHIFYLEAAVLTALRQFTIHLLAKSRTGLNC